MKKVLTLITVGILLIGNFYAVHAGNNNNVLRISGVDRYETCSRIVHDGWKENSDYAVLVNGENFPDALSASTLAKKYKAPILLTQNDRLNDNACNELKSLSVKHVFIVGGEAVINTTVEQTIKSMNIKTTRYYGQDRDETSIKIAEQIGTNNGIVLAVDNNFSDALSVSSIAAKLQIPIILIPKDTVPESIKNFITGKNIPKTYVLGGTDIINDSVANQFPNVQRISGQDKYERNINIINSFSDKLNFDNIYLAYSEGFADAISGSAIAALEGNPIILIGDNISNVTSNFIKNKISSVNQIIILGGTAGIKDSKLKAISSDNSNKPTSQKSTENSFDININLRYNITLDDKVKGTDPNIIRAVRQAIFDTDCYFIRLYHYNRFSVNNDVLIFDIKGNGKNYWEVYFKEKKSGTESYDTIGCSRATVEKQSSGRYVGSIIHSSIIEDPSETY